MKKTTISIVWIFLCFFVKTSFGQGIEFDEESGLYAQIDVLEFENKTKDDLFDKTLEWFTLNYNSVNDAVQLKNKESGKIIIKGLMVFYEEMGKTINIEYTLIFEFKESRLRYTFTGFSGYCLSATGNTFLPIPNFESTTKQKVLSHYLSKGEGWINNSIQSLIEYVKLDNSDDW
tara:strand:- start:858 stop:1382 length:525 start_codon:yes stop_codon:yes gene_type:complete